LYHLAAQQPKHDLVCVSALDVLVLAQLPLHPEAKLVIEIQHRRVARRGFAVQAVQVHEIECVLDQKLHGTCANALTAEVSVSDFANRPPRALADGETFSTGSRRWRFINTPQVPHAWDAGHLFEETQRTLFCSDLLNHEGDVAPLTEDDVVGPMCEMLVGYDGTPFADYFPYTAKTEAHLRRLADLEPELCATMHGSSYWGDGRGAIEEMAQMLRETLRPQPD